MDPVAEMKSRCRNLEDLIQSERSKLRSLESRLERYESAKRRISRERLRNEEDSREIMVLESKERELASELYKLREVIVSMERDKMSVSDPLLAKRKRAVNQTLAEIRLVETVVQNLDARMRKLEERNAEKRAENRRELAEWRLSRRDLADARLLGAFNPGPLIAKEREQKASLDKLREKVKKKEDQIKFLRADLYLAESRCWDEQVKVNRIRDAHERIRQMDW